jgi:hypothetical protein
MMIADSESKLHVFLSGLIPIGSVTWCEFWMSDALQGTAPLNWIKLRILQRFPAIHRGRSFAGCAVERCID